MNLFKVKHQKKRIFHFGGLGKRGKTQNQKSGSTTPLTISFWTDRTKIKTSRTYNKKAFWWPSNICRKKSSFFDFLVFFRGFCDVTTPQNIIFHFWDHQWKPVSTWHNWWKFHPNRIRFPPSALIQTQWVPKFSNAIIYKGAFNLLYIWGLSKSPNTFFFSEVFLLLLFSWFKQVKLCGKNLNFQWTFQKKRFKGLGQQSCKNHTMLF